MRVEINYQKKSAKKPKHVETQYCANNQWVTESMWMKITKKTLKILPD